MLKRACAGEAGTATCGLTNAVVTVCCPVQISMIAAIMKAQNEPQAFQKQGVIAVCGSLHAVAAAMPMAAPLSKRQAAICYTNRAARTGVAV